MKLIYFNLFFHRGHETANLYLYKRYINFKTDAIFYGLNQRMILN